MEIFIFSHPNSGVFQTPFYFTPRMKCWSFEGSYNGETHVNEDDVTMLSKYSNEVPPCKGQITKLDGK